MVHLYPTLLRSRAESAVWQALAYSSKFLSVVLNGVPIARTRTISRASAGWQKARPVPKKF